MTSYRCAICRRYAAEAEPCRWCLRVTCARCHHRPEHLRLCPDTARRET